MEINKDDRRKVKFLLRTLEHRVNMNIKNARKALKENDLNIVLEHIFDAEMNAKSISKSLNKIYEGIGND